MTASHARVVQTLPVADAKTSMRHVFVRDLVLDGSVGVYEHERAQLQKVRINLDLAVREGDAHLNDEISNVVCYEVITNRVRDIVASGHVNLVETLAENIASMCLEDPRVRSARVRVEKLEVFEDAASVGVEIERSSPIL